VAEGDFSCYDPDNTKFINWLIPVAIITLVIILLVAFFIWRSINVNIDVAYLPNPWYWKYTRLKAAGFRRSDEEPYYYYRTVADNTPEQQLLDSLVLNLDFGPIHWNEAMAIVNPTLAVSCSNYRRLMLSRIEENPKLFNSKSWQKEPERSKVIDFFNTRKNIWNWNNTPSHDLCPVLAAIHATSLQIAKKIASVGFASLSLLDAGFYGKGIYFSTFALYTLPYFISKKDPVILICYVLPGNPYPVIESASSKHSLVGSPIKLGYQSHYVITLKNGNPPEEEKLNEKLYDELVINQEGQVVPLFILKINKSNIKEIKDAFDQQERPLQ